MALDVDEQLACPSPLQSPDPAEAFASCAGVLLRLRGRDSYSNPKDWQCIRLNQHLFLFWTMVVKIVYLVTHNQPGRQRSQASRRKSWHISLQKAINDAKKREMLRCLDELGAGIDMAYCQTSC